MDERFVSLASLLRVAPTPPRTPAAGPPTAPAVERSVAPGVIDFAHADLVHDLALMKLAAGEAFENASRRLLRLLANDLLGRELLLGPVDLEGLVRGALAELSDSGPVALAVSAADAERVRAPLPVRVDPALGAGDLVVEVRDGTLESHFTFRLESALERAEHGA